MRKLNFITGGAVLGIALTSVLLLSAAPNSSDAHHAFAAEFDANRPIRLEGKVKRVMWVNPHSWVHLDVVSESGEVQRWEVEFGGPYSMLQKGLRRTDLPIDAEVVVNGYLAKSGANVVNASDLLLPDGRDFFTAAEDSPAAAGSSQ